MSSKKVLFLILHTQKYQNRYFSLTNTWLKDQDYIFYSDHEDTSKNIIKVSDRTDYHSNEDKFVNVITTLDTKYMNYDWYFFVDDGTFVNVKKLYNTLDIFDKTHFHGCKLQYYPADRSLEYYSGGAGILVPGNMIKHLKENFKNYNTGFSDVSLGFYMREYKIPCFNTYNTIFHPYKFENILDIDIANSIAFHYITDESDMIRYQNACSLL